MPEIKRKALKAALPYSLPICISFLAIGMAFGIYISGEGFSFIYPLCMSAFIFAGSMEILTVNLLLSSFNPIYAFLLTLMVNARHLFYGIAMLERYKNLGRKKWYLIYGMCDETFSINCSVIPPKDVDRGWFMFFVTLLNHIFWVTGATLGGILSSYIKFNTKGIDFVLTALFVVTFLSRWDEHKERMPSCVGILVPIICLLIFGPTNFMIPAMLLITVCLIIFKDKKNKGGEILK